jgi:hypothetical protein
MSNPWLEIPLGDYEGHMASPEVGQLEALADLFGEVLRICRPASVAVLGVAGGNGLEHCDGVHVSRVVGVDVNPRYLEDVRQRHGGRLNLELLCHDLAEEKIDSQTVDLVHAALVFEHAGVGRCLENAIALVSAGGAISVVLQLPAEGGRNVGASPFASLQRLKDHFTLIDPEWMQETLEERGFQQVHEDTRVLPAGKKFWVGIFQRLRLRPQASVH